MIISDFFTIKICNFSPETCLYYKIHCRTW